MDWSTIGGILLALGAAASGAWVWFKDKAPKAADAAADIAQKVIDRIQGDSTPGKMTRLEALQHAEALASFLEDKPSKAASESLQTLVMAIMDIAPVKE
jgi:hypothetical protein